MPHIAALPLKPIVSLSEEVVDFHASRSFSL
jgi:hypothetical protein